MNGAVQHVLEQNLLQVAQAVEQQVDSQLHKLEHLEEDDLERIRQRRLDDMKRMQHKRQEWMARGHGEYREVEEREFFAEMKGTERMVCHFYRDSLPCHVMDRHLALLAAQHIETKFVKVHAEKAPFLTERLKIWMLPTVAVIQNEKTTDYVVGLDELGGKEDFTTETLAARLAAAGALFEDAPPRASQQKAARTVRQGGPQRTGSDEDSDFD